MRHADFDRLTVGEQHCFSRSVTQADIQTFADLSGDHNPVHLDPDYAAGTAFGGVIAHGMLSAALISGVLGMEFPGRGTVYLEQNLRFRAPVRPGDQVDIQLEVLELLPEKRRVRVSTTCLVAGKKVVTGDALLMLP